jgi:hypothetical protein
MASEAFAAFEAKLSAKCANKHALQLFAVEVFAGTGRLTASLRQLGLRDAFGIDHILSDHLAAPILQLDLLQPECLAFLENHSGDSMHLCPFCTTLRYSKQGKVYQTQRQIQPSSSPNRCLP